VAAAHALCMNSDLGISHAHDSLTSSHTSFSTLLTQLPEFLCPGADGLGLCRRTSNYSQSFGKFCTIDVWSASLVAKYTDAQIFYFGRKAVCIIPNWQDDLGYTVSIMLVRYREYLRKQNHATWLLRKRSSRHHGGRSR
jgi:hypothetical protein